MQASLAAKRLECLTSYVFMLRILQVVSLIDWMFCTFPITSINHISSHITTICRICIIQTTRFIEFLTFPRKWWSKTRYCRPRSSTCLFDGRWRRCHIDCRTW
jgi:hypothetical protein